MASNSKRTEQAQEEKFVKEEHNEFKISAIKHRMLAKWAAEEMNLSAEHTDKYVKHILKIAIDEDGTKSVITSILNDLMKFGSKIDKKSIEEKAIEFNKLATKEIYGTSNSGGLNL